MKRTLSPAPFAALLAVALAAGCASPPPPPPTPAEIAASETIVAVVSSNPDAADASADSPYARKFLQLPSKVSLSKLPGGTLRAQIRVKNIAGETLGLRYRFAWSDKDGTELVAGSWKSAILEPLVPVALTDICTDPDCVSCEVTLRVVPPDDIEESEAGDLTVLDFDDAADQLVKKFVSDREFAKAYKAVAAKLEDGVKPVIVVRSIENATKERNMQRLAALARNFRVAVRTSGRFDLKEDAESQMFVDRIRFSADGGLEGGELLNALKTHVSPDFVLTGVLQEDDDPGVKTYRLFLALHDLSGRSGRGGTIAWEDKATIRK